LRGAGGFDWPRQTEGWLGGRNPDGPGWRRPVGEINRRDL